MDAGWCNGPGICLVSVCFVVGATSSTTPVLSPGGPQGFLEGALLP